jgi:hypothetical protein
MGLVIKKRHNKEPFLENKLFSNMEQLFLRDAFF